jgi:hypothetical protein
MVPRCGHWASREVRLGKASPHRRDRPRGRREIPAASLFFRFRQQQGTATNDIRVTSEGSGEMFAKYAEQFYEVEEAKVDWGRARCRDMTGGLLGLFFSEELGDIAAAKRICSACPLLEPCLQGATERREPWGVWGGQLFLNGKILPFKRKRGRPPKNPAVQLTA